jgi:hypothetical protein
MTDHWEKAMGIGDHEHHNVYGCICVDCRMETARKQGAREMAKAVVQELRHPDLILSTYTNTLVIDRKVFESIIKQLEGEKVTK